jgi:hypothetical protein
MNNDSQPIDAEIIQPAQAAQPAPQALQRVNQNNAVGAPMSVEDIVAQVQLIQKVMDKVMTDGEHYGKIPGCGDKKTLLKPGAEKLCMTFRIAPKYVIQETRLERGHKEYRVVCSLESINGNAFLGSGVGECSTMESKYRYRGGARKCPVCGKETIITAKKFKLSDPGGWLCWAKKGGCGATWLPGAPEIENQSIEKVENPDPADTYNTVLKMAKKRAFVDATITATAASDIFTQDIGDNEDDGVPETPTNAPGQNQGSPHTGQVVSTRETKQSATSAPQNTAPRPQNATSAPQKPKPARIATDKTRAWAIEGLKAGQSGEMRRISTEYFRALAQLLPNEEIEELPLRFVPVDRPQLAQLVRCIGQFEIGDPAVKAFEPHGDVSPSSHTTASVAQAQGAPSGAPPSPSQEPLNLRGQVEKPIEVPRDNPKDPKNYLDASPYWAVIVPIPHKGQKRDEYLKDPDTIGSLFNAMKAGDQESQKRLWGFALNFEPKGWIRNTDGKEMPPNAADITFRKALDQFVEDHGEREAQKQTGPVTVAAEIVPGPAQAQLTQGNPPEEEDDIPF